jgi:hypothetical protein
MKTIEVDARVRVSITVPDDVELSPDLVDNIVRHQTSRPMSRRWSFEGGIGDLKTSANVLQIMDSWKRDNPPEKVEVPPLVCPECGEDTRPGPCFCDRSYG